MSQNLKKLERESGGRKIPYLLDARYLCCGSKIADGHAVTCENYPMEVS